MRKAKRKWIISMLVCAAFKMAVVAAGLFILSTATRMLSGELPPVVSAMAIIGAAAVIRECLDAVVRLENIIAAWERYMKRRKLILARLNRTLKMMGINKEQRQRQGQIQGMEQEASV